MDTRMETRSGSTSGQRGATSAAGNANKALDDLQGAVHHGEQALKAAAANAVDKVTDKVEEARDRLTSALEAAKATYAKLEDKAVASAKATDKLVREHPYPSLGVAFGIGLLVGVLINRK